MKMLRLPQPPPLGLEPKAAAVGAGGHAAVEIGSKNGSMPGLQARKHIWVGVTEGVFKSCRNQGDGGRYGIEEGLRAGSARAVVGDFEDVGMEVGAGGQEPGFDGSLHIAGEQKGSRPVADPKHQGIVVTWFLRCVVVGRSQDFDPRSR